MAVIGHNQYGKDEIRVVRVVRAHDEHRIFDYNVSVSLVGDFDAAHTHGDNRNVLPTDTVKNTTFANALRDADVATPESYGLALARHFVADVAPVARARVSLQMYPWTRLGDAPDPHSFMRSGNHVRTASVTHDGTDTWVVSGIRDITILKTTDSGFEDFHTDEFTTLQPARDRILATSVTSQWWHASDDRDWDTAFTTAKATLLSTWADHDSLSLQHSVFTMGEAVLATDPGIHEIRFTCPNSHHFEFDLAKVDLDNPDAVYHADDRPYGQIEATIRQDDAPDPGHAFDPGQGW